MGKPSAPTPPNPYATASAATSTNVATAIANANLGNVNQVTPQGNLDYSNTGNYDFTDPVSGANYSIPQFTATQTLSPEGAGDARSIAGRANTIWLRSATCRARSCSNCSAVRSI